MKYITFDDVLIKPAYSEIIPKETSTKTNLTKDIVLDIPLISSPMDTVTGFEMAKTMAELGGIGFLHHNMSLNEQVDIVRKLNNRNLKVGMTISVNEIQELSKILKICKPTVIIIDSAHGHTKKMINAIKDCKKLGVEVIAGNIATAEAAKLLIEAGVDALKVGIGCGSICTTRIVTGIGVPQISAIKEVHKVSSKYSVPVIADGGIRLVGDCCKALAAGASTIVLGSVLAGSKESPGGIITKNSKKFKVYRGMGSKDAMKFGSAERYNQDYLNESDLVEEGISAEIPYKGSVVLIIKRYIGGIKNSFAYVGARNIQEYQKRSELIKVSQASIQEGLPHIKNII